MNFIGNSDIEALEKSITPLATQSQLEIVDIEYIKPNAILRITLDKAGGVTLEDCANFSRSVSTIIDVEFAKWDLHFNLEVSSPGIDRVIKKDRDFIKYCGAKIRVKTFAPIDGQRNFTGILKSFQDGNLVLSLESGEIIIEKLNIAKANLVQGV